MGTSQNLYTIFFTASLFIEERFLVESLLYRQATSDNSATTAIRQGRNQRGKKYSAFYR
jgi:hypothetical protein